MDIDFKNTCDEKLNRYKIKKCKMKKVNTYKFQEVVPTRYKEQYQALE
jgi:hypothetical protein